MRYRAIEFNLLLIGTILLCNAVSVAQQDVPETIDLFLKHVERSDQWDETAKQFVLRSWSERPAPRTLP